MGYDPWLHTPKEVDQFRTACERSGAELVTCVSNPLDAVWVNRPDPPSALAIPHHLGYAGQASAEKREDLARKLKSDRVDVAILTAPDRSHGSILRRKLTSFVRHANGPVRS